MDMLKVPQWIKSARKGDDDMPDDVMPPPPIATLPEFDTHDEESLLMQRAAALHAQLRRNIEAAQIELAETVLGRQGDQQKIGYLEKENAELRLDIAQLQNTVATLQADVIGQGQVHVAGAAGARQIRDQGATEKSEAEKV